MAMVYICDKCKKMIQPVSLPKPDGIQDNDLLPLGVKNVTITCDKPTAEFPNTMLELIQTRDLCFMCLNDIKHLFESVDKPEGE